MILVIAILIIGLSIWAMVSTNNDKKQKVEKSRAVLRSKAKESGFEDGREFLSYDSTSAFYIDQATGKLLYVNLLKQHFTFYSPQSILEVEIFRDGESVHKTSRTSQVAGAAIGGLLLGGAGAIIGGLSGTEKSNDNVDTIEIRMVVNDLKRPVVILNTLNKISNNKVSYHKNSPVLQRANQESLELHSMLKVIMKREDVNEINSGVAELT